MAHERDHITLRRHLLNLVPEKRLRAIARETEAVQRSRKIDVVHLFWTLVLGFGAGVARSFAGQCAQRQETGVRVAVPLLPV